MEPKDNGRTPRARPSRPPGQAAFVTVNTHSNDATSGGHAARRSHATDDPPRHRAGGGVHVRREPEDWGRVKAVVDVLPDPVLIATGTGLELTNAAADRLFAEDPVLDRADLMSRFEPVGIDRTEALPLADPLAPREEALIVRQRNRPNQWFALRTVKLDPTTRDPSDDRPPSSAAHATAGDADEAAPVAFVLRDVTDTPDLRPLREAFLGLVSHELRTPITTIYAGSTVLARSGRLSVPATRTLAHDVSAEAARLYDVVEDLLALGRIERSVLDPLDEPVDVGQVIGAAIRVVAGRHPAARIRRRGRTGAILARGDATYLEQAFRNLVLAVARRPGQAADAAIEVDVAIDRDRGELNATIRDDGPAVTPAELDSLFDLVELGAPASPLGGLGLYVARQLIESTGGRVSARLGSGGRGLEIRVALRLA
jgi:signal transduction histidine kinase